MKSAYLYVRVSTDEQKRRGFSLIEQEERLLSHCEVHNILVKGIFREDYSAKNFERPEWKKLIGAIKANKRQSPDVVLFLKWDRFSRNIEHAFNMLAVLRNFNVKAIAIDQTIDLEIPENKLLFALYLAMPEAENARRGLNTSQGMRRARKMGRWPGKAPIGYINITASDGRKFIIPKQPEAAHINWIFGQLATGTFTGTQVKKMAEIRGFNCGKSKFWSLIRNPVYCGVVVVPATKNEAEQFVKGAHEPIIHENLFYDVQQVLK